MLTINLTDREARVLRDVLDAWLADYEEATDQVIADRTLDTPEMMLEAVESIHEDFNHVTNIIMQLPIEVE